MKIAEMARAIAPVYEDLEWRWAGVGIPDAADITATISRLYSDLRGANEETVSISSGRLRVHREHTWCEEGEDPEYRVFLDLGDIG